MPSYNLGRAVGTIRIVYNSSGAAAAQRDVASLEARLDSITNKAVDITVNDADAQRRIDVIVSELDALSEAVANPSVDLSDDDFRRRFTEIQGFLDELSADSADPSVNIHLDPAELARLTALREQMTELDGDTADVRVRISTQLAQAELEALQGQVNHLDGQTITIRARIDRTLVTVNTFLFGFFGILTKVAVIGAVVAGVIELITAAVAVLSPVVAALTGSVAVLVGLLVAAFSGLALLAGAAVVAFKPIIDAKGDLTKLNAQQQQLLFGVRALSNSFKQLAGSVQPQVYSIATKALQSLNSLLPKLQPLLVGTANAVDGLATKAQKALNGPWTQRWIDFLTREGPSAVTFFGTFVGKLGATIGNVLIGFEPLFKPAEDALTKWVTNIQDSSRDLDKSKAFQNFLAFIKQTGPEVINTLSRLGRSILDLAGAVKPAAGPLLDFLGDIGDAVGRLSKASGFAGFVDGINRGFQALGNILKGNSGPIANFLKSFSQGLADLIQKLAPVVPHLLNFASAIFKAIDNIVKNPGFPKLVKDIGSALDALGGAIDKASKSALITGIISFLDLLARAIQGIFSSPIGPITVSILALVAAIKALSLLRLGSIIATVLGLNNIRSVSTAISGIGTAIGRLAAIGAIVAVGKGLATWANATKNARADIESIEKSTITNKFDPNQLESAARQIQTNVNTAGKNNTTAGGAITGAIGAITGNLFNSNNTFANNATIDQGTAAVAKLQSQADNLKIAFQKLNTEFGLTNDQIAQLAEAGNINLAGSGVGNTYQQLNAAVSQFEKLYGAQLRDLPINAQLTSGFQGQGVELDANAKKVDALANVVQLLTNKQASAITATDGFHRALNDLGTAIDANSKTLVGSSDAAINNRATILNLVSAAEQASQAYAKSTGKTGDYQVALQLSLGAIEQQAAAIGLNKQQVDNLIRSLGLIPPAKNTKLSVEGPTVAESQIQAFLYQLSLIPKEVVVPIRTFILDPSVANQLAGSAFGVNTHPNAQGSVRRNGVPGGVVQWAEAGGESFIPHDPAKRSRSIALLMETARILGVTTMANGGIRSAIEASSLATAANFVARGGSTASTGILNQTTGASIVTDHRKTVHYSPTWQYVGPTPDEVAKQTQRDFDWNVGR